MSPLLEVQNLQTEFKTSGSRVRAVRGVSFQIERGETLGIVGESGSGKSVTALSIMGLIPSPPGKITEGSVKLDGKELLNRPEQEMDALRGSKMAMVFQDPFSCLNPTMRIGEQIAEPVRLHTKATHREAKDRVMELLRAVRIPSPELRIRQFPHEISGGQRQRIMIAMAFACDPQLLIADEPTTALDVTVQAQILDLLLELRQRVGSAVILITHDLGVVAEACDRVVVMYAGQIVETAPVKTLLQSPKHPYTQGLLAALPQLNEARSRHLVSIPGQPPDLSKLGNGCPFYARCSKRIEGICDTKDPPLVAVSEQENVRCHLYTMENNQ